MQSERPFLVEEVVEQRNPIENRGLITSELVSTVVRASGGLLDSPAAYAFLLYQHALIIISLHGVHRFFTYLHGLHEIATFSIHCSSTQFDVLTYKVGSQSM